MAETPLWLEIEPDARPAAFRVRLATCRNCGRPKATSDPCGFDHLAALHEFQDYIRRYALRAAVAVIGCVVKPQAVPCTSCGAASSTPCLTRDGRRAHYSHAPRKREAALPRCVNCTATLSHRDIRLCLLCRQEMNLL